MKEVFIKIIKVFFTLYILSMFIIAIDGLTVSNSKKDVKTKYIIVYGSKVEQNGEVSERLKARLDKGLELLKHGKNRKIIVSGGVGETGFNEAKVMKQYLISKGVKIPRIIVDDKGNTTMDTSKNSYEIILKKGEYPNIGVIGVSQFFHNSRVRLSLKKAGFVNISTASPDYFELRDIYSLIREVSAYIKYFFMGVGDGVKISFDDFKVIFDRIKNKF